METPTLRQLEYAVAVADHKHFGQAAKAVNVSQPGLSSQIAELETRLGVQLFERAPRRIDVTEAGADVIERARTILRDVDDVVLQASVHSQALTGTLRVGVVPSIVQSFLPHLIRAAQSLWDDIEIDIQELQPDTLLPAIDRGHLDIALLTEADDFGELHLESVADEPYSLIVPNGHPFASRASVATSTLSDNRILVPVAEQCLARNIQRFCDSAGITNLEHIDDASFSTMVQLVAAGRGLTLVPNGSLKRDARPDIDVGVCAVPVRQPAPVRTISVGWRETDPRRDRFVGLAEGLCASIASN